MEIFEWVLVLLVSAVLLTAIARRLNLPYPSLLALGGTALALLPYTPELRLDPELTLALFVAPALLDAAFDTSLRDLRRNWVPVMCMVLIAVGLTTFAVAWLIHWLVPGMPWAAAIAVGAIVAPPDAVAATAVMRRLKLPHRVMVIIEGESLLNDATALLVYRIAVSVAMGATFTAASVPPQLLALVGSVAVGFGLAHLMIRVADRVTDIPSSIVLQFAGGFGVWILAEKIGLSAIVTLVTFAITAARISPMRQTAQTRLPSFAVWETVVFVLNVLAFVLIGLQLRPIIDALPAHELNHYLRVAAAVLGMVMGVRLLWVFLYGGGVALKLRWSGAAVEPSAPRPTMAGATVVGWAGMRGIVTLAAAYALPHAFPYRELALLCAFCVVVGTLVIQGLTLRPLILALGLTSDGAVEKEVRAANDLLARVAAGIIDGDQSETARVLRDEFIVIPAEDGIPSVRDARNQLRARIIDAQRRELVRLRDNSVIGDDAFHQIEERLDRIEVVVS